MDPNIWGPHAWFFLHTIAINYPENPTNEIIKKYKRFISSFVEIIPCNTCKKGIKKIMFKKPLTIKILKNRELFVGWINDIHNQVNKKLGKKTFTLEESIEYYRKKYNDSK
jgi:hypothetical protein